MNFDPSALPDLFGRFHPLLLHFPIALLAWAAVVELICVYRKESVPGDGPVSLSWVVPGAAFSILAAISGWLLADPADPDSALAWHRWLGVSAAFLATVTAGVGIAVARGHHNAGNSYRLALFLCVPVVMGAGHIGGELKWGDGFVEKGFEKVFFAPESQDLNQSESTRGQIQALSKGPVEQASQGVSQPAEEIGNQLYHDVVRPLLDTHCISCHGPEKSKGKLRLDIPNDVKDRLREEPVFVAGDPEASLLIELVKLDSEDDDRMPPPEEPGLTADQIKALEDWIRAGGPWPEDSESGRKGPVGFRGELGAASPGKIRILDGHEEDGHEEDGHEEDGEPDDFESLFSEQIYPLLELKCFECHGEKKQKGGLRLDLAKPAMADREFPTIIPGDASGSELILRIELPDDDEDRMPPTGDHLSLEEVSLFRKWIDGGAVWPSEEAVPLEDVEESSVGTSKPAAQTPGQLPRFSPISIEDPEVMKIVESATRALTNSGVRVAPISQSDSAHEAVFRLLRKNAGDAQVQMLKGLEPVLTRLDVAGTAVSRVSVAGLWKFRKLRILNLSETVTTDDDLATLASLPELTVLNLFGTQVSDAGLDILAQMRSLKRVYLWRTKVSPEGAKLLANSRPDLLVDIGEALSKEEPITQD